MTRILRSTGYVVFGGPDVRSKKDFSQEKASKPSLLPKTEIAPGEGFDPYLPVRNGQKRRKKGGNKHSYGFVAFVLLARFAILERFRKRTEPAATATTDSTITKPMFKLSGYVLVEYGMSP
jgi:hypothetical protein